jgi:hypothetical protein
MSAWNCIRKSFSHAPPSTLRTAGEIPESLAIACITSRVWKPIDSRVARVTWARVVPRVRPTIVPRACSSQ